jgi:hypothetical protein
MYLVSREHEQFRTFPQAPVLMENFESVYVRHHLDLFALQNLTRQCVPSVKEPTRKRKDACLSLSLSSPPKHPSSFYQPPCAFPR